MQTCTPEMKPGSRHADLRRFETVGLTRRTVGLAIAVSCLANILMAAYSATEQPRCSHHPGSCCVLSSHHLMGALDVPEAHSEREPDVSLRLFLRRRQQQAEDHSAISAKMVDRCAWRQCHAAHQRAAGGQKNRHRFNEEDHHVLGTHLSHYSETLVDRKLRQHQQPLSRSQCATAQRQKAMHRMTPECPKGCECELTYSGIAGAAWVWKVQATTRPSSLAGAAQGQRWELAAPRKAVSDGGLNSEARINASIRL